MKKLAPETVDLSKNKVLKKAKKARAPKVGDEILVISYGQRGTLVKQLKDGRWEAQVGLIKMTLKKKIDLGRSGSKKRQVRQTLQHEWAQSTLKKKRPSRAR